MGKIVINVQRCKGCGLCKVTCPQKIIGMSETINDAGFFYAVQTNESKCIGCTFCGMICPECAIEVYR